MFLGNVYYIENPAGVKKNLCFLGFCRIELYAPSILSGKQVFIIYIITFFQTGPRELMP